jgi:hypothetical protein
MECAVADGTQKQVEVIASNFHMRLKAVLKAHEWDEMRKANRQYVDTDVCASHDYCDANVYMGEAFEMTVGREPDPASRHDADLWSRAWKLAHRMYLTE